MHPDTIYLGRDNTLDYRLLSSGRAVAWGDAVTRIVVQIGQALIDSDESPSAIWWDQQTIRGVQEWVLHLRLGMWSPSADAAPLAYGSHHMMVIVFDPDHPNGLVWERRRSVEVM